MEKGLIEKDLLQNNISQLELYTEEENKCLKSIKNKLLSCNKCYKSTNSASIENELENIQLIENKFLNKRKTYANILRKAIALYERTSEQTKEKYRNEE